MINGQSAGKDYAYLLGTYFGDASIVKRTDTCYTYTIEAIDRDFVERVADEIKNFTGKRPNIFERGRKTSLGKTMYALTISKKETFRPFYVDTGKCNFIPEYVYDWPEENKIAFIEGVLDSDGWVSARKNPAGITQFQMGYGASFSWVCDIKRIMESLGIDCCKIREYKMKSGKTMYTFTINMRSFVESKVKFTSTRKNSKVIAFQELKMCNKPQRLYA